MTTCCGGSLGTCRYCTTSMPNITTISGMKINNVRLYFFINDRWTGMRRQQCISTAAAKWRYGNIMLYNLYYISVVVIFRNARQINKRSRKWRGKANREIKNYQNIMLSFNYHGVSTTHKLYCRRKGDWKKQIILSLP